MLSSTPGLRKGAWTEEEDNLLRKCIETFGEGKWHQVPYRAGLNRCRKSCRLRWLNYLRPNIKRGNFGLDEVDLIIRLHKLLGNRWSLIAGRLPGRTANDVKNYWNSHIKKQLRDGAKREAGGSSSKSAQETVPKTTASTIIKPRPLTFSKNVPWLRKDAALSNTRTNDKNSPATGSIPNSLSTMKDHDMQWLENLLNDEEMNDASCLPFADLGDESIASLWSKEILSEAKEGSNWKGSNCTHVGQDDFGDFCINLDLDI